MRSRSPFAVAVSALLVAGVVAVAQVAKPSGAATPQEAIATARKAVATNDPLAVLPFISPRGLKDLASEGVTGVMMVIAFSDPDDPMPGGPKPSAAELAARRKRYKEAVDLAKATLKPYKLDTLIGKPVMANETQKSLEAALATADNQKLITEMYAAMVKMGPMLGMKEPAKPPALVDFGTVTGYKISGDSATAQNGAETIVFTRIGGRWFIEPPSSSASSPSAPAPATQQPGPQAPRAAAAGKDPEIVVGGVQVARMTVADDDFSAKPFHANNGTTVVLWVKMPAGSGLIEIDDDTSVLQTFTDDKGTTLSAKFGSFPQEFKDGTGGLIEIESKAFAAPGATALLAEGSIAMTIATGTRKTRVANVALRNDATLMFGQTKVTVAEVQTQGDSLTFSLKLPRQVMVGIKNVVFLDARGQVIEGRRTSSGYMNDAGELGFTVKTAARTLTLEFEAWQGLRTMKVPFKVRAKLGLEVGAQPLCETPGR